MNSVLDTTRFVVEHAEHVRINHNAVRTFAQTFGHSSAKHWLSAAPFDFSHLSRPDQMRFVFLFNALSFCYWGEPKWTVEYGRKSHDGAWGMILALGRAVDEGAPLLDFARLAAIDRETFAHVLRANVEIPLFEERLRIAHEVGTVLSESFGGDVEQVVRASGGDAVAFADMIVRSFPAFADHADYRGEEILFNKRAQLLSADLSQLFGILAGTDGLTACADYKLPQILRKHGILEYDVPLAEHLDRRDALPHGSAEEVEIRASTIWAVEEIKRELQKRLPLIRSYEINDHLWLATQEKYPDDKPYHRTRTTAY